MGKSASKKVLPRFNGVSLNNNGNNNNPSKLVEFVKEPEKGFIRGFTAGFKS